MEPHIVGIIPTKNGIKLLKRVADEIQTTLFARGVFSRKIVKFID